jgi:hypothetical protein
MTGETRPTLAATIAAWSLAVGAASPAFACGSGKVLYEEKFAAFPAWIAAVPEKAVGANGLVITESTANTTWYQGPPDAYGSAEFCMTVSAQASGSDVAAAGVAVYVFNADNYYRVAVSNISGQFSVERRMAGQWTVMMPYTSNPAIRTGPTAENEISVRTSGTHAVVSMNDKIVAEFDAAVAFVNDKRQSYLDLIWIGYASDKPAYTFTFKDLQVREAQ